MYIGRFAPSPSGPLHMGSLLAALASYLDAKAHNGQWLLRIEDIDPPREQAGASELIIEALKQHHLLWDGDIIWQHNNLGHYQAALTDLQKQNVLFACQCTRQQLKQYSAYPGFCRNNLATLTERDNPLLAVRINTQSSDKISFTDTLQGVQQVSLDDQGGDFILQRKDGLFAYNLAVVCDDEAQKISHIVRGIDLLDTTPQHIFLQQTLGFQTPEYLHIPVLIDETGNKLSKQFGAPAINLDTPKENLLRCLSYLQQEPPQDSKSCEAILEWAIKHWNRSVLKNKKEILQ